MINLERSVSHHAEVARLLDLKGKACSPAGRRQEIIRTSRAFPDAQYGFWSAFCQEEGLPISLAPIYAKLNGAALFSPPPGIHPNEFTMSIDIYYKVQGKQPLPGRIIGDWDEAHEIIKNKYWVTPQSSKGTEAEDLIAELIKLKAKETLGSKANDPLVRLVMNYARQAIYFAENEIENRSKEKIAFNNLLDIIVKGGCSLGEHNGKHLVFAPKKAA